MLSIAVQGCCHGELDSIYNSIRETQARTGKKVDLLLLCGDLQCVRDAFDLQCVAVPQKYRKLNTFHQYVSGEKQAPVMTVFVGGNHEASNILQSLYYGGFVAPNIYFLGFGGVITYKGLRIGGVSGIYNEKHYHNGHNETPPYTENSLRSVYHLREIEVHRLKHLKMSPKPLDVFLSHDWPSDIWNYGNKEELLRIKPYFLEDMNSGNLGNPALKELLQLLQPSFWFAAHLHVKFAAVFPHSPERTTRFLALDKVIPGRGYLQFLDIPVDPTADLFQDDNLHFDLEWLRVLAKTHSLVGPYEKKYLSKTVPLEPWSIEEINSLRQRMVDAYGEKLVIPNIAPQPLMQCGVINRGNYQTDLLLNALGLPHTWTVPATVLEDPFKAENSNEKLIEDSIVFEYEDTSDQVDPNEIDI